MELYDVAIIGGGPIGMASAIACQKANLSHIMIDKGTLVNSIFNYPLNMTFFSTSDKLEIGEVPFISHNPKPTRDEALEYYRRVAMHWKLNARLYEKVIGIVKNTENLFLVSTTKQVYQATAIIISTGFYDIPNLMGIPGEGLAKVHHYYKEPHLYFNQKLLVVGAANSAVDVALETFRKGAEVTMVIRENEIQDNVKYWVKPDIENRIKEGEICAYFNSNVKAIREDEIDIITPDGPLTVKNDFVLAMTGYKPDFSFLISIGVELNMDDELCIPMHNPDTMETNVAGIYLAGVICGGTQTNKWFIENSRIHAEVVVDQIRLKKHLRETGKVQPA
jgi:thioredoxin reductase (NADPH)